MRERHTLPVSERLLMLESEVGRLQSDYESEKGTRARANADILAELKLIRSDVEAMQRKIWMAIGGVGAVTWLIEFLKH